MSNSGRKAITRVQVSVIIVVIVAAVAIAVASPSFMSQPSQPSQTTQTSASMVSSPTRDTLTIDAYFWPASDLNTLYDFQGTTWTKWTGFTVYQTLVGVNETAMFKTGNIQYLPALAQNWTVSPDGLTYTFNLRPDVTFSSGNPLTSYGVWLEYYMYYYLTGNSTSWNASYAMYDYTGVNFGPETIAEITQSGVINPTPAVIDLMSNSSWPIYVNGPHQLIMRIKGPASWFPGTLTQFSGGDIYDAQWVLDHGGFGTPGSINNSFNLNPIPGSGPYVVTQVAAQQFVKFQQDPNYWALKLSPTDLSDLIAETDGMFDPGHAKTVVVQVVADNVARYNDVASGKAQIATVQPSMWPQVLSNPSLSYLQLPPWAGSLFMLGLNTQIYPTNDVNVRNAIVRAINYTDLDQTVYGGNIYGDWVGPEYPLFQDSYNLGNTPHYQYNLTLAKEYLAKAHLTSMPTLDFRVLNSCDVCSSAAQVIQSNMADLGFKVNIEVLPPSDFWTPFGSYSYEVQNAKAIGQFSFSDGGEVWAGSYPVAADPWVEFVNNASQIGNFAVYSNPTVQKCVNGMFTVSDVAQLQTICKAAQQQIYLDAPYIWIGVNKLFGMAGGSLVWRTDTVTSFKVDYSWAGASTEPAFNTVMFTPNPSGTTGLIAPVPISGITSPVGLSDVKRSDNNYLTIPAQT